MSDRDPLPERTGLPRLAARLGAAFAPLALILGLMGAAEAVPTPAPVATPADAVVEPTPQSLPYGQGVLWQIEREGAEPSFLFGTVHLNRDDILALPQAVKQAFAKARSASFEILFDEATTRAMSRIAFTGGRNTLDALLGPDLFADVVDAAEPYGMTVHHVRHLKPWAVMLLMSKPPSVHESESAEEGRPVLDAWLFEQAEARGIPTFGLETVRQHLSPFMDLDGDVTRRMVRSVLEHNAVDQTEIERRHAELVGRYLEGDIEGILTSESLQLTAEDRALRDTLMIKLLDDRNHLMVERMMPRLKEGRAFVAVGAGHLPGEEGILKLLTERGYSVKRLH